MPSAPAKHLPLGAQTAADTPASLDAQPRHQELEQLPLARDEYEPPPPPPYIQPQQMYQKAIKQFHVYVDDYINVMFSSDTDPLTYVRRMFPTAATRNVPCASGASVHQKAQKRRHSVERMQGSSGLDCRHTQPHSGATATLISTDHRVAPRIERTTSCVKPQMAPRTGGIAERCHRNTWS